MVEWRTLVQVDEEEEIEVFKAKCRDNDIAPSKALGLLMRLYVEEAD